MAFFHFNITEKYTAALMELFGSLENVEGYKIPIKYSSLEKAALLSDIPEEILHSGNVNVLPRMCLSFTDLSVDYNRSTNKFRKVNIKRDNAQKINNYQFNFIPYNFHFTVTLQTRGMSEALVVAEQVLSRFNPSYTLLIDELGFQDEPSSLKLELTACSFDSEEYSEVSSNIVTVVFDLMLYGHIFQPVMEQDIIKEIILNHNVKRGNEIDKDEYILGKDWYTNSINIFQDNNNFDDLKRDVVISDIILNDGTLKVKHNHKQSSHLKFSWSVEGVNHIKSVNNNRVSITTFPGQSVAEVKITNNFTGKVYRFKKLISI